MSFLFQQQLPLKIICSMLVYKRARIIKVLTLTNNLSLILVRRVTFHMIPPTSSHQWQTKQTGGCYEYESFDKRRKTKGNPRIRDAMRTNNEQSVRHTEQVNAYSMNTSEGIQHARALLFKCGLTNPAIIS